MTQIDSHNKQNKANIARTIAVVYNKVNDIPDYLKKKILKELLWATTIYDDHALSKKYQGQVYWTVRAMQQFLENNRNKESNRQANLFYNLRHEHAVPKKEIINKIIASNKSEKVILEILNNLGHSVVVSKSEDDLLNKNELRTKMPGVLEDNSTIKNIFSRYIKVGIKVCDIRGKDLKQLTSEDIADFEKNTLT